MTSIKLGIVLAVSFQEPLSFSLKVSPNHGWGPRQCPVVVLLSDQGLLTLPSLGTRQAGARCWLDGLSLELDGPSLGALLSQLSYCSLGVFAGVPAGGYRARSSTTAGPLCRSL